MLIIRLSLAFQRVSIPPKKVGAEPAIDKISPGALPGTTAARVDRVDLHLPVEILCFVMGRCSNLTLPLTLPLT